MDVLGMNQNINRLILAALLTLLIVVPGSRSQSTETVTPVDNSTTTNNNTFNSTEYSDNFNSSTANNTNFNSSTVNNTNFNSSTVNNTNFNSSMANNTDVTNTTENSTNVTTTPAPPTTPGMISDNSSSQNTTIGVITTNTTNYSSWDLGNQTMPNNYTTSGPTTITPTTIAPTTTTAAPVADAEQNRETSVFIFELTVGPDNSSDIQYDNPNVTIQELQQQFASFFYPLTTKLFNSTNSTTRPGTYTLRVEFSVKEYFNKLNETLKILNEALEAIEKSNNFTVPNTTATNSTIADFTSELSNVCKASGVCELGFTCFSGGCEHMCRRQDCNHHGTCYTSVLQNSSVTTLCQCDSSYETEYLGDTCQYSRRGRLQIIAIIAGVLGATILVLVIVIIVLCVKFLRHGVSANYNLSGSAYANNAYDNQVK